MCAGGDWHVRSVITRDYSRPPGPPCVACGRVMVGRGEGNYVCPVCMWAHAGRPLGRAGRVLSWWELEAMNAQPRPQRSAR